MAKDPAFLFYPNDYLGGTIGMSLEEKGAYIELLMAQFNRGHMGGHMCGQIVGQSLWDRVKHKFVQDSEGLWFNERLELEKSKRQQFTSSRRNNLTGKNQYSKRGHMGVHMENENENIISTNTNYTIHGTSENLQTKAGETDSTEKTLQKDLPKAKSIQPIEHLARFLQDSNAQEQAFKFAKGIGKSMTIDRIKEISEAHDAQFNLSHKGGDYQKWCQYFSYFIQNHKPQQDKKRQGLTR